MKKSALRALIAGASLSVASSVFAIGVGSDDETITVQLNLPEIIDIRGLAGTLTLAVDTATDINNPTATGSTDFSVCGIGFSNYNVTLTSTNGGGSGVYTLENTAGDSIAYSVAFNGSSVLSSGMVDQSGGFAKDGGLGTCTTTNASLSASVDAADLDDADGTAADTYTDTLTIMVEPV